MKILFYDNGLNTELAVEFVRAGHSVKYVTPWTEAFPKPAKAWIGRNLDGVEVVESFSEALKSAEFVVCPDTFSADRVEQARQAQVPCWGAGHAEKMELDRLFMKQLQASLGLEVGPYSVHTGIEELMRHLMKTNDRWIKTSKYRQYETFRHDNWEATRNTHLGAILDAYGPTADEMVFISEEPLKGVEVGLDRIYTHLDSFIEPGGWGYEKKDEAYIGTFGTLPPLLQVYCDKLERPLYSFRCNSFVSNEVIVTEKDHGKMIEPTIRGPHPPLAGMLLMYSNIPSVILGKDTILHTTAKYCAVLVMRSSWAGDHWLQICMKEPKYRKNIKLSMACFRKGEYYAVPGNEFVGYIAGTGQTPEAAAKECKAVAETVSFKEMDVNPSALDEIIECTIPDGRKVGVNF
jgi:hypothetical protein